MPDSRGYRVDRLRRRRRTKLERWQAWALYVLAVAVAFAAVWGAWYVGARLVRKQTPPPLTGYVALLKLTSASGKPIASALAIRDAAGSGYSLFVVPQDLLLDGPQGQYVFAGDAMGDGTLRDDLQRVIGARVDAVYTIPAHSLAGLAGASELRLTRSKPVELAMSGTDTTFKDKAVVQTSTLPDLFAASGPTGVDAADMQQALWSSLLQAAALRPASQRSAAVRRVVATAGVQAVAGGASGTAGGGTGVLADALKGLGIGAGERRTGAVHHSRR